MLHLPPLKHLMFAATLALLAVAPVQAKEKFKVITTTPPTSAPLLNRGLKSTNISRRPGISNARRARSSSSPTA